MEIPKRPFREGERYFSHVPTRQKICLPEKRDETIPCFLAVVRIARQLVSQQGFFLQEPEHDQRRKEGKGN